MKFTVTSFTYNIVNKDLTVNEILKSTMLMVVGTSKGLRVVQGDSEIGEIFNCSLTEITGPDDLRTLVDEMQEYFGENMECHVDVDPENPLTIFLRHPQYKGMPTFRLDAQGTLQ